MEEWIIATENILKEETVKVEKTIKQTNFMAPLYGWGLTASRLEPLRGGILLFTTKFPEIPGTYFTDLRNMKGNLGASQ